MSIKESFSCYFYDTKRHIMISNVSYNVSFALQKMYVIFIQKEEDEK